MAHDGTGTGWDTSSPSHSEYVSDGDKEIRDLRLGVETRVNKEHVTLATASAGGEHKAGSAVAYYQASAPTLRPDAATTLTAADNGRLFIDSDDKILYVYVHGSGFIRTIVDVDSIKADAVTTLKILDGNVTAAKLATILDLSSKTLTLPTSQTIVTPTIASFVNATHNHVDAASGGSILNNPYIVLVAKYNNSYQSVAAGSWVTVSLTDEVTDTDSLCTLTTAAPSRFTLATGYYRVNAIVNLYGGNSCTVDLYNNTSGAIALLGMGGDNDTGAYGEKGTTTLTIKGRLQVTAATDTYSLRVNIAATSGRITQSGISGEYYGAVIELWKEY